MADSNARGGYSESSPWLAVPGTALAVVGLVTATVALWTMPTTTQGGPAILTPIVHLAIAALALALGVYGVFSARRDQFRRASAVLSAFVVAAGGYALATTGVLLSVPPTVTVPAYVALIVAAPLVTSSLLAPRLERKLTG